MSTNRFVDFERKKSQASQNLIWIRERSSRKTKVRTREIMAIRIWVQRQLALSSKICQPLSALVSIVLAKLIDSFEQDRMTSVLPFLNILVLPDS